jgi:hypothetical protein
MTRRRPVLLGAVVALGAVAAAGPGLAQPDLGALAAESTAIVLGVCETTRARWDDAIINLGPGPARACSISPSTDPPAIFAFQTTNPASNQPTGTANSPVDIAAGAAQSFVLSLTPTSPIAATDFVLNFKCSNSPPAPIALGLNTLLFAGSATATPDVVALAATADNTGFVDIPGPAATGVFAVATVNVGAAGVLTVSTDTGGAALPVSVTLCRTDPQTGQCISAVLASVTTTIEANATPSFAVFVRGLATVPADPGGSRVFVRIRDGNGVTRGSTSVAVRTR